MRKLILFFMFILAPTVVFADPLENHVLEPSGGFDSYAVLSCKGAAADPYFSAFYNVSPNSPFPNSLEIISLNPARYESLLGRCRGAASSVPIQLMLSTANYGNNGCRNVNQGCTQTSQCCEGTCDSQLGFCRNITGDTAPSNPGPR